MCFCCFQKPILNGWSWKRTLSNCEGQYLFCRVTASNEPLRLFLSPAHCITDDMTFKWQKELMLPPCVTGSNYVTLTSVFKERSVSLPSACCWLECESMAEGSSHIGTWNDLGKENHRERGQMEPESSTPWWNTRALMQITSEHLEHKSKNLWVLFKLLLSAEAITSIHR